MFGTPNTHALFFFKVHLNTILGSRPGRASCQAPKAEAPPALKARDAGSGVWTKEALTGKMGQLNSQANWIVHFPPQLLEEGGDLDLLVCLTCSKHG